MRRAGNLALYFHEFINFDFSRRPSFGWAQHMGAMMKAGMVFLSPRSAHSRSDYDHGPESRGFT